MDDNQLYLSAVVGLDVGSPQLRMMTYSHEGLTRMLFERPTAITVSPLGALIPERLLELFARIRSRHRAHVATYPDARWRFYCRQAHEPAMHFERFIATDELSRWHVIVPGGLLAFVDDRYVVEAKLERFDSALAEAVVSRSEHDAGEASAESLEVRNYFLLKNARADMLQRVETYSSVELAAISHSSNANSSSFAGDLRRAGKVIAVRSGREWLYPRFQFDARLKPVRPFPEIKAILAALAPDPTGWDHLQWFLDSNPQLNGQTPLNFWNVSREQVVEAAQKGSSDDRD
jgi:hypothetical protein